MSFPFLTPVFYEVLFLEQSFDVLKKIFILFGFLVLASSRVLASHNKDDFLNELNGIQEINCYLPEVLVLREYSFSLVAR